MHCPAEIADIVLSILQTGLLRIRALAWNGQADRCGIETDHIHNLPDLLADYSPEKLSYYWNVERPEYIRQIAGDQLKGWERLWQRLGDQIDSAHALTARH